MPTVEEVIAKYVELRDRKAERVKVHQAELAPINEAMDAIESWTMKQLNDTGVDSFKTKAGTAYKAVQRSVSLQDGKAFKEFVFTPAVEAIYHYLTSSGYDIQPADLQAIDSCLQENTLWDMVDFRAGKKGVTEHLEKYDELPPGVSVESTTIVNVRRA